MFSAVSKEVIRAETDRTKAEIRKMAAETDMDGRLHPINGLDLAGDEEWYYWQVDKEAFGSMEIFFKFFKKAGVDPNHMERWTVDSTEAHDRECYWISDDKKAYIWCYNDPRETDDAYPRYVAVYGVRDRAESLWHIFTD